MYFKYFEYLDKRRKSSPIIYIDEKDTPSKNEQIAQFNFYSFFNDLPKDILKTMFNELDIIYNYSIKITLNYINKESWLRYQISKSIKIPFMNKKYSSSISSQSEKSENITAIYSHNSRKKELEFTNEDFLSQKNTLNLFENMSKKGSAKYIIALHREAICNNAIELLYAFLECIFTSNNNYCIKKCEYCTKYYVATKTDNQYCKRNNSINNKIVSCSKVVSTIQKSYEYKKLIEIDKNFVNSLSNDYKYSQTYIDDYNDSKKEIKKNCFKKTDLTELKDFIKNYKSNNPPY